MKIAAVEIVVQHPYGADQVGDPVLRAHLAEIEDEVGFALLERGVGVIERELRQRRRRAHDKDVLGALLAALDRDPLVAFIGGDDDLRRAEAQPFRATAAAT